jgi:hypothetical protein
VKCHVSNESVGKCLCVVSQEKEQTYTVLVNYRTALDDLERLVVQRLFELSKLSMSGTG